MGLSKKFGRTVAVDDLSLTLFQNQILVLLGHNGAGKTSIINMLTAKERASAGQAILDGNLDILQEHDSVVDAIGVCPQENCLLF